MGQHRPRQRKIRGVRPSQQVWVYAPLFPARVQGLTIWQLVFQEPTFLLQGRREAGIDALRGIGFFVRILGDRRLRMSCWHDTEQCYNYRAGAQAMLAHMLALKCLVSQTKHVLFLFRHLQVVWLSVNYEGRLCFNQARRRTWVGSSRLRPLCCISRTQIPFHGIYFQTKPGARARGRRGTRGMLLFPVTMAQRRPLLVSLLLNSNKGRVASKAGGSHAFTEPSTHTLPACNTCCGLETRPEFA